MSFIDKILDKMSLNSEDDEEFDKIHQIETDL